MQSGSKLDSPKRLIFERVNNARILSNFSCGLQSMDDFIHDDLQDYISMGSCQMYVIKEDNDIVAMFCLDQHNLSISEVTKEKMQEGLKPAPQNAPNADSPYWFKSFFDAMEISYLAVSVDRQRQHVGSYIIERIMDKLANDNEVNCDFVTVRALKQEDYTAVPFYQKCGFYPAEKEVEGRNLFMYRIIVR